MYQKYFDDWTSLSREDAMLRAYALGVDAALGNDHPEEVDRLQRETSRPLVELAFDEGKSAAEEKRLGSGPAATEDGFEAGDRDWALWEDLVESRRDDPESLELVRVPSRQTDVPDALSRPGLLDANYRDVDAVELPRFLLE